MLSIGVSPTTARSPAESSRTSLPPASEHDFGVAVRDYPLRSGKGFRAALCLASTRVHGGTGVEALRPAAAIELLHAAFLVHDDIQDGSDRRRGEPTLHRRYGVPLALNAGDALAVLSFEPLQDAREQVGGRIAELLLDEFRAAIWRTLQGQAVELGWRAGGVMELETADYLRMVLHKTSCYTTILPLRMGAIIGRGHRRGLDPLSRFGHYLGAAFQIQDDLLNLIGELEPYGKEIKGDLYEGKRSLPIVHLLNTARDGELAAVRAFLARPRTARTVRDVEHLATLLDRHRSIEFARSMADDLAREALAALAEAVADLPDNEDVEFLRLLVDFVTSRRR